jgi:hypothetical protein
VADFLRGLRAHGSADLNALLSTLNDGSLARQSVEHWTGHGWITIARDAPLVALAGPRFDPRLTLARFCGAGPAEADAPEPGEEENDEDS